MRQGLVSAYPVLREREWRRQRQLIVAGLTQLLDASVVRPYQPGPDVPNRSNDLR